MRRQSPPLIPAQVRGGCILLQATNKKPGIAAGLLSCVGAIRSGGLFLDRLVRVPDSSSFTPKVQLVYIVLFIRFDIQVGATGSLMDIGTVLTSTLVATAVSGLIAGFYGLRTKQREYLNEYHKIILARRIAAYEQLEALIIPLKTAVLDHDNRPYHLLFSQEGNQKVVYDLTNNVIAQALWLSDDAFKKGQELNRLMFTLGPESGIIEFGKTNYVRIAELRHDLEQILATDLLGLHNIKRFLHEKRNVKSSFQPFNPRGGT